VGAGSRFLTRPRAARGSGPSRHCSVYQCVVYWSSHRNCEKFSVIGRSREAYAEREDAYDLVFYLGAGDENRTRTISLGISEVGAREVPNRRSAPHSTVRE
jgi:hypothetical protein